MSRRRTDRDQELLTRLFEAADAPFGPRARSRFLGLLRQGRGLAQAAEIVGVEPHWAFYAAEVYEDFGEVLREALVLSPPDETTRYRPFDESARRLLLGLLRDGLTLPDAARRLGVSVMSVHAICKGLPDYGAQVDAAQRCVAGSRSGTVQGYWAGCRCTPCRNASTIARWSPQEEQTPP